MQHRLDLSATPPRSPVLRWMATAAAGLAMAVGAAAPASAWTVDHPKLTDPGVDFGTNWDTFAAPLNGGDLVWDVDSSGEVRPHLTGNLYLNNAAGVTARMQIGYYDAAHNRIATEIGGEVTAPDNGLHAFSVDLDPFGANNVYHVHVSTTTETSTPGVFQFVGTEVFDI